MTENSTAGPKIDLRPVIARLREIERRCATMSSRSEEFPAMQEKVAGIIARLEAGEETSGDPLDFRRIARELFPVTHLFESTGFMSIGKELAHIERSLTDLSPAPGDAADATSGVRASARISSSAAARPAEHMPVSESKLEKPAHPPVPIPVIVGLLVLVLAAAGAAAVIFRWGPFARPSSPARVQTVADPTPPSVPTPQPDPDSRGLPAARPDPSPTSIDRGRLSEEVAAARLALIKNDLETAGAHLSEAARIDRTDADVVEIAGQVVGGLVSMAYGLADNAEWENADPVLERAERVAMRFGVSTSSIDRARTRIAAMDRYVRVNPGDRQRILQSTGRRVEILLDDGETRTGRIENIDGGNLVLNMDRQVGGGVVRYSQEVPLQNIRSLKIFED